jgi:Zn-dependent protease with chaperone function
MLFLLSGFLMYTVLLIIRVSIVFFACKYYKQPLKENLDFDFRVVLIGCVIFTLFFGGALWIGERYATGNEILALTLVILFVSLIPSYHFLISPLQHLFMKKKYYTDDALTSLLRKKGYNYHIRIIKGNVNNIYATGILPYTKTILVGESLMKGMNQDQLEAILFHEIGHHQLKHLNKLFLVNIFCTTIFCLALFLRLKNPSFFNQNVFMEYGSIALISGLVGGLFLGYAAGKVQYKLELQADTFAASVVGKENITSSLEQLDKLSNGDVSKGGVNYPTLKKRIENINKR